MILRARIYGIPRSMPQEATLERVNKAQEILLALADAHFDGAKCTEIIAAALDAAEARGRLEIDRMALAPTVRDLLDKETAQARVEGERSGLEKAKKVIANQKGIYKSHRIHAIRELGALQRGGREGK